MKYTSFSRIKFGKQNYPTSAIFNGFFYATSWNTSLFQSSLKSLSFNNNKRISKNWQNNI